MKPTVIENMHSQFSAHDSIGDDDISSLPSPVRKAQPSQREEASSITEYDSHKSPIRENRLTELEDDPCVDGDCSPRISKVLFKVPLKVVSPLHAPKPIHAQAMVHESPLNQRRRIQRENARVGGSITEISKAGTSMTGSQIITKIVLLSDKDYLYRAHRVVMVIRMQTLF